MSSDIVWSQIRIIDIAPSFNNYRHNEKGREGEGERERARVRGRERERGGESEREGGRG